LRPAHLAQWLGEPAHEASISRKANAETHFGAARRNAIFYSRPHYAFSLAQRADAEVAGLADVDLPYIEAPIVGAIDEQLKKQFDDLRKRLREAYERECQSHRVSFDWILFEGEPLDTLSMATETRDIVVTGHDTAFRFDVHEQLSDMLARLLLMTPRPVSACADEMTVANEILIAYDGSVPAMRAVQLFALLGFGRSQRIQVTSIDASRELVARRTSGVVSYLRRHGYEAEAFPIASSVHPSDLAARSRGSADWDARHGRLWSPRLSRIPVRIDNKRTGRKPALPAFRLSLNSVYHLGRGFCRVPQCPCR
jgi:hypothetical protein